MFKALFFLHHLTSAITHPLRATKRLSLDHCQHVQAPCSVHLHKKEKPFIYLGLCKHDGSRNKMKHKRFLLTLQCSTAFPCMRRNKPQKASRAKGNNELSQYWHNHAHLELWEKFSTIIFITCPHASDKQNCIAIRTLNKTSKPTGGWWTDPMSYGNINVTLNCTSSTRWEWSTLLHRFSS